MQTLVAAVVVLGVLIFVHELGHLLAAKSVGIGVYRFSLGLGSPTPLKFTWGETEYAISWVPFGGYVKIASKEEDEQLELAAREGVSPGASPSGMSALEGAPTQRKFREDQYFENKPLPARMLFISAGVIMNFAFAYGLYTYLSARYGRAHDPTTRIAAVDSTGLPVAARPLLDIPYGAEVLRVNGDTITTWDDMEDGILDPSGDRLRLDFAPPVEPVILPIPGSQMADRVGVVQALRPTWDPRIGLVSPGRPAERAGLEVNDVVTAVNGDSIRYWDAFVKAIERSAGDSLVLTVSRGDSVLALAVVPEAVTVRDPVSRKERSVGRIGVGALAPIVRERFGFPGALVDGWHRTVEDAGRVWATLVGFFRGSISPRELGGPILIGQVSGQVASLGIAPFLGFMAIISINLAILNMLPIPILDGGHLLFLIIEGIRGKPLSVTTRTRLSQVGLVVLLAIMVFALANDVMRIIGV